MRDAGIGSTVLFTLPDGPCAGEDRPAVLVTFRPDGRALLHVHVDASDVPGQQGFLLLARFLARRAAGDRQTPGAWRPRVEADHG